MNDPSVDAASSAQDSSSNSSPVSVAKAIHKSTYDKAEEFLSREIFGLNANDRNAIHEEIHGVRCMALEESPELILKSLDDFWKAVAALPESSKVAYQECKRIADSRRRVACIRSLDNSHIKQHYAIDDPSFHLRFLRCELFDAHKAATRYVNYLEFVYEFWGHIAIEREIKFSDFTKEEVRLFRKGNYQLLPVRDQSGRKVLVCLRKMAFETGYDLEAKVKVIFYLWNSLSFHDVESQRKGVVAVVIGDMFPWNINGIKSMLERRSRETRKKLFAAFPIRIAAMHQCLPDTPLARVCKTMLAMQITSQYQRLRFVFHLQTRQSDTFISSSATSSDVNSSSSSNCSALHTRYKLKGYGIPIELLPHTESGSITTKNHSIWIKTRKYFEEGHFEEDVDGRGNGVFRVHFHDRASPVFIVDSPGSNDVLFRQGKTMMEHPGNVMFRDVILDYLDQEEAWEAGGIVNNEFVAPLGVTNTPSYISHPVFGKYIMGYGKQRVLNSLILNEIYEQRKGRFLEWDRDKCVWALMTDLSVIKSKISFLFSKCRNRKATSSISHPTTTQRGASKEQQQRQHPTSSEIHTAVPRCKPSGNDATDAAAAYQFVEGRMPVASFGEAFCNPKRNVFGDSNRFFVSPASSSSNSNPSTNTQANTSFQTSSEAANRKRSRKD